MYCADISCKFLVLRFANLTNLGTGELCRFQVGIQLDLLLLLKLAVVVFVFNQDGSKDRLLLLLGLAGVIYL